MMANPIALPVAGVAALSLIAALAMAVPASAQSVERIANLTGPDRQKTLEAGARKEAEMLWVGSFNEDNAKPILDSFQKKYPYIKIDRVRTDSTKALQRVLAELRAKTSRTDLITSSHVLELKEAGAIQAFKSPILDLYPAEGKDPTGYSAPLYYQYFGMAAYHTGQVSAADAPKTYDDLLNPKWKGQLVWSNSGASGAPFLITFLRMHWGEEKTVAYLEKLSKQGVVTRTTSGRTVIGIMAAGEHKVMIHPFLTHVAEHMVKKAPVAVTLQDPVSASATPFMVAKFAPHPHATMLMVDHLLDKESQTVLRDAGYYPAHPGVEPTGDLRDLLPRSRGMKTFLVDDAELSRILPESTNLFSKYFE